MIISQWNYSFYFNSRYIYRHFVVAAVFLFVLQLFPFDRFEWSRFFRVMVFNATFNNISVISWRSVVLLFFEAIHIIVYIHTLHKNLSHKLKFHYRNGLFGLCAFKSFLYHAYLWRSLICDVSSRQSLSDFWYMRKTFPRTGRLFKTHPSRPLIYQ